MRTRLWICNLCGAVYRRYKTRTEHPSHCGKPMRSARKWPSKTWFDQTAQRHEAKRERAIRERQTDERRFLHCRDSEGHPLAISRATKSAWRSVEQLKVSGRPLISRASKFLSALRDDLGPYGLHGTPEVKLIQTDSYCLGRYHRSLLRDIYEVELQANRPLDEIRATLLHETLHFIDDIAGGRHRLGDTERKYRTDHWVFEERLADFKRRLGGFRIDIVNSKTIRTS